MACKNIHCIANYKGEYAVEKCQGEIRTACGATVSFDNEYYNNHKNEAVKAWNRRVDNG